jgi:Resolvase, N terminal domain
MHGEKAFLYCSTWPEEMPQASLDAQSVELQAYCLIHGLEVSGLGQDTRPARPGHLREGLESLGLRAKAEGVRHLVIQDPSRLSLDPREALQILMGEGLQADLTIHVAAWQTHTSAGDARKWLFRFREMLPQTQVPAVPSGLMRTVPLRQRPLWSRVYDMLQDERYAEHLLRALFDLKAHVRLNAVESEAVHSGYDHLHMFQALGYRIKGERTENTRLVADVLTRHWDKAKTFLADELQRTIEGHGASV